MYGNTLQNQAGQAMSQRARQEMAQEFGTAMGSVIGSEIKKAPEMTRAMNNLRESISTLFHEIEALIGHLSEAGVVAPSPEKPHSEVATATPYASQLPRSVGEATMEIVNTYERIRLLRASLTL